MMGHYPDLAGKTVLVTGASSGIGRAVAIALGAQQARIVLTGRDAGRLQETRQAISGDALALPADLTRKDEREKLVQELPMLDGLCHAAGIIHPFPIRYVDDGQFDRVFDINGKAPVLLTSRLLGQKKIRDGASLVFVSSIASGRAMKGGSIYSASKAALEAFSRTVSLEHSARRIRSNCLQPALVKTPIYDQARAHAAAAGAVENYDEYVARYPLGIGTADDVAAAALFLLSDASRWITSTSLVLDGGLSATI